MKHYGPIDAQGNPITAVNTPGRNVIVNGDMRIAQRGTSFTNAQSSFPYTLDRWQQLNSHNAGNITVSQETSILPDSNTKYAIKVTNAAGNDTSMTGSKYCWMRHTLEGYHIVPFLGKSIVLSFWVRSSKTGTYCVSFNTSTATPFSNYITEYTISSANTWEFKTIPITYNPTGGGAYNYTNGMGLQLNWTLATGPNFQVTKDAWLTNATYYSTNTSSQVNWLNETGNTFYLANVQLELGSTATDFERRRFDDELMLCQRYYEKSYSPTVAPGTNTSGNSGGMAGGQCYYSPYSLGVATRFSVTKRGIPAMSYWDRVGTANRCSQYYDGNWQDGQGSGMAFDTGLQGFLAWVNGHMQIMLHWTADAEL